MFSDAMKNYQYGPFHTFDGSGVSTVTNLLATYPNPAWPTSQCQAYDRSVNASAFITTTWSMAASPAVKRVCGYINGVLSNAFSTTGVLSGSQTYFRDLSPSSPSMNDKRVYCISAEYCAAGSTLINYICFASCPTGSTVSSADATLCVAGTVSTARPTTSTSVSYECTVGLVYNGAPIDLTPKLTQHGVTFMFTDTSSSDSQFDIYVGELNSADSDKTHVVNIPTGLAGCGRSANPISFTDEISSLSVGQIVEYGITATQTWNNGTVTAPTSFTKFPYRIPFLVTVNGKVAFKSGDGVKGVLVSLCHIDPITKLPDADIDFCPIVSFITDNFGDFAGEIRVSNPNWINLVEYFSVYVENDQVLSDGTIIAHSFDPLPIQAFSHAVGTTVIMITDTTETTIYGSTLFDNVGGLNCPMPGVPVELTRDNGDKITTTSASDGSFAFTVTLGEPVHVRIPSYNGYTWSSSWISISTGGSRRLQATTTMPSKVPSTIPSITPSSSPSMSSSKLPSSAPSATPSMAPSSAPSTVPSSAPSIAPSTSPSTSPMLTPTTSPSIVPTCAPTNWPSSIPTVAPTLLHYASSQLMHQFTFDNVNAINNKLIPDNVDILQNAALQNGLSISLGSAIFAPSSNVNAQPYLMLPAGIFGITDAVSLEFWASFDAANNNNAVLMSIGTSPNNIKLTTAGFAGLQNAYIAILINPAQAVMQVYVNGILSRAIGIPSGPLLGGSGSSENFNYIGWDKSKTTPGMSAQINEIRIWAGLLSNTSMAQSLVQGCDPSYIAFASTDVTRPLQITYKVTSKVTMAIGMYGGLSMSPMFGIESSYQVTALDPQCSYNVKMSLSATSTAYMLLPAMNYTVTLLPYTTSVPAPKFTGSSCASSLDPYSFILSTQQLSQTLGVDLLNSTTLNATFIYRSGLCLDVIGSQNFSTTVPSADTNGLVCYSTGTTILNKGDIYNMTMKLYELYPSSSAWLTTSAASILSSTAAAIKDFMIPNSEIDISDLVSAIPSLQQFPYAGDFPTLSSPPPPLNYSISAGDPRPSPPFELPFQVFASRIGPEGVSQISYSGFVPILGTLPTEVPDLYPVSTNENLIFMVLRDPPGGGSFSTIHAGTTFSTAVTIDGMRTFEKS